MEPFDLRRARPGPGPHNLGLVEYVTGLTVEGQFFRDGY